MTDRHGTLLIITKHLLKLGNTILTISNNTIICSTKSYLSLDLTRTKVVWIDGRQTEKLDGFDKVIADFTNMGDKYGRNNNALLDVLRYPQDFSEQDLLIVVSNASMFLKDEPSAVLQSIIETFYEVGEDWKSSYGSTGRVQRFNVVFNDRSDAAGAINVIKLSGLAFDML